MMKPILAAAFVVAATSAASAQATGFNPGTVVSNVYESLYATYGYDFGFGYSPPPYGHEHFAQGHRHTVRERVGAKPRIGAVATAER